MHAWSDWKNACAAKRRKTIAAVSEQKALIPYSPGDDTERNSENEGCFTVKVS